MAWAAGQTVWRSGDRAYVPTLEELLQACGSDFYDLHYWSSNLWQAKGKTSIGPICGGTPLEAVARLWLALQ
jgi:hypothetical protein